MLPSSTLMNSRRNVLALMAGAAALALLPTRPAHALSPAVAQSMIQQAIDQVFQVINSGRGTAQMYRDFEAILERYADVDIIARTVLGPVARQASPKQFAAYRNAFRGYLGRKYGKRFREFIGSKVEVTGARPLKSFVAVSSVARLNGRAPMEVEWHVSDKSGQPRFFNLIIEGVNMIASERAEVAAMLARRNGDIVALTADLQKAG